MVRGAGVVGSIPASLITSFSVPSFLFGLEALGDKDCFIVDLNS